MRRGSVIYLAGMYLVCFYWRIKRYGIDLPGFCQAFHYPAPRIPRLTPRLPILERTVFTPYSLVHRWFPPYSCTQSQRAREPTRNVLVRK